MNDNQKAIIKAAIILPFLVPVWLIRSGRRKLFPKKVDVDDKNDN